MRSTCGRRIRKNFMKWCKTKSNNEYIYIYVYVLYICIIYIMIYIDSLWLYDTKWHYDPVISGKSTCLSRASTKVQGTLKTKPRELFSRSCWTCRSWNDRVTGSSIRSDGSYSRADLPTSTVLVRSISFDDVWWPLPQKIRKRITHHNSQSKARLQTCASVSFTLS